MQVEVGNNYGIVDTFAVAGAADERAVGIAVRASRPHAQTSRAPGRMRLPHRPGSPVRTMVAAVLDA